MTTNYNVDIIDILEFLVLVYIGIKTKDSGVIRRAVTHLSSRNIPQNIVEDSVTTTDFEV